MILKIEDLNSKKLKSIGAGIMQVLKDNEFYKVEDNQNKTGIKFFNFEISKRK